MNKPIDSTDIENACVKPKLVSFKRRVFGRSISNIPIQNPNEVSKQIPLREIYSKNYSKDKNLLNITLAKNSYSKKTSCTKLKEVIKTSTSFCTSSIPKASRTEYEEDIDSHLFKMEQTNSPVFEQTEITKKMRGILIDWLVDVHLRFKLRSETLFLTVNIIDKYLTKATVSRQNLQLLGVTAMFIACKYEEIYAPEIKNFAYITDNSYTKDDILNMERQVLKVLDFNVTMTSSYQFLQRFIEYLDCEEKVKYMAQYLIELALLDCNLLTYKPSIMAAAALYITNRLVTRKKEWNVKMAKKTRYTDTELKATIKELMIVMQLADKSSLKAIKNKFARPEYREVSKFVLKRKIK